MEATSEIPRLSTFEGTDGKARSATVRPRATFFPNVRDMDWDDIVRLARQTVRRGRRRRVRKLHRRQPVIELRPADHDDRPGPERELLELNRCAGRTALPFSCRREYGRPSAFTPRLNRVLPLVAVEPLPQAVGRRIGQRASGTAGSQIRSIANPCVPQTRCGLPVVWDSPKGAILRMR